MEEVDEVEGLEMGEREISPFFKVAGLDENRIKRETSPFFPTHLICIEVGNDFVKANDLAVEDRDTVKRLGHHRGRVLPLLDLDMGLGQVGKCLKGSG